MFPKIVVPQNGWFIRENPIKMDDLGGYKPLVLETPKWTSKMRFRKSLKTIIKIQLWGMLLPWFCVGINYSNFCDPPLTRWWQVSNIIYTYILVCMLNFCLFRIIIYFFGTAGFASCERFCISDVFPMFSVTLSSYIISFW